VGFISSDGTVVDTNGTSALTFHGLAEGSYYVVIQHRNHLPVMSLHTVHLDDASARYDFTTAQTKAYGTNAMYALDGGVFGLIPGDVDHNGTVYFTGDGNDRSLILSLVGFADPTVVKHGYYNEDVNLDGIVRFTNDNSDRSVILLSVGIPDPTVRVHSQVPN
jgi:hypothetical protein